MRQKFRETKMRGDCPICHKVGYLILEKPRKKSKKTTNWDVWQDFRKRYPGKRDWELKTKINVETRFGSRNIPHRRYKDRIRNSYYRFFHYTLRPKNKVCYLGCLDYAIRKLEKISKILENRAELKKGDPEKFDKEKICNSYF